MHDFRCIQIVEITINSPFTMIRYYETYVKISTIWIQLHILSSQDISSIGTTAENVQICLFFDALVIRYFAVWSENFSIKTKRNILLLNFQPTSTTPKSSFKSLDRKKKSNKTANISAYLLLDFIY